jgi:hypothetical protein
MVKRVLLAVCIGLSLWGTFAVAQTTQNATRPLAATRNAKNTLKVPLNDTGVSDVRFVNPRRPASVWDRNAGVVPAGSSAQYFGVEFLNRTSDRKFIVTLPAPFQGDVVREDTGELVFKGSNPGTISVDDPVVKEAQKYFGVEHLRGCKIKSLLHEAGKGDVDLTKAVAIDHVVACDIVLTVQPNKEALLPSRIFAALFNQQTIRFRARLFQDNKKLTNAEGYLRTDSDVDADGKLKPIDPPEGGTTVAPAASLDMVIEPRFTDSEGKDVLSDANPYDGHRKTHFPGSARIDVEHKATDRYKAELSFSYNGADFGNQEEKGQVTADQYKLSVFSLNLLTLNFGKYDFAAPADGLAITESGQGFTLSYPTRLANYVGSYIIKRERDFKPKTDGDASSFLMQVNDIELPTDFLRSMNITGVYGTDDSREDPHVYRTLGAETFFSYPMVSQKKVLGGSLALFRSSRSHSVGIKTDANNVETKNEKVRGRGTSGLLKLTMSNQIEDLDEAKKPIVHYTFGATVAVGPSDRESTTNVDEGYLGETGTFGPGLLFFKKLSKPLIAGAGDPAKKTFGSGLQNKIYYALEYRNNDHSPLELFARALNIDESDIVSKSTTFTIRHFEFRNSPYPTKNIGNEYAVVFDIETPESVTVTMKMGYFAAGSAFDNTFKKNPWFFAAGVKIEP